MGIIKEERNNGTEMVEERKNLKEFIHKFGGNSFYESVFEEDFLVKSKEYYQDLG